MRRNAAMDSQQTLHTSAPDDSRTHGSLAYRRATARPIHRPAAAAEAAESEEDLIVTGEVEDEEDDRQALNIMYDKRVFRGNTHNANLLKQNLTPAQKEEQRIKQEREKKKVEMIKK